MTTGQYVFMAVMYLLIFWGAPLSVTQKKSKKHRFMVVLVFHGMVGALAYNL